MSHMANELEKFEDVLSEKKPSIILIYELKYGQAWKIRTSSPNLSLYNPFKLCCFIDETA